MGFQCSSFGNIWCFEFHGDSPIRCVLSCMRVLNYEIHKEGVGAPILWKPCPQTTKPDILITVFVLLYTIYASNLSCRLFLWVENPTPNHIVVLYCVCYSSIRFDLLIDWNLNLWVCAQHSFPISKDFVNEVWVCYNFVCYISLDFVKQKIIIFPSSLVMVAEDPFLSSSLPDGDFGGWIIVWILIYVADSAQVNVCSFVSGVLIWFLSFSFVSDREYL